METPPFEAPDGLHRLAVAPPRHAPLANRRLFLFRIPADFPVSSLNGVSLPARIQPGKNAHIPITAAKQATSSSSSSTKYALSLVAANAAAHDPALTAFVDASEAVAMRCLHPSPASTNKDAAFIVAPQPFDRVYHIAPSTSLAANSDASSRLVSSLVDAGVKSRSKPYVPRSHPDNLSLKSLPFGFDADERVLIESMHGKPTTAPTTRQPDATHTTNVDSVPSSSVSKPTVKNHVTTPKGKKRPSDHDDTEDETTPKASASDRRRSVVTHTSTESTSQADTSEIKKKKKRKKLSVNDAGQAAQTPSKSAGQR